MQSKSSHKRVIRLNSRDREAILNAKDIIMADVKIHMTIPALARKVNMNECKLKAGFKQLYGEGIFSYLLNARLDAAKRMLSETDMSVKEIAFQSGYKHVANFITTFKKKFNTTPGSLIAKQ